MRLPEGVFVRAKDVRGFTGLSRARMETLIDEGVLKPRYPPGPGGKPNRSAHPMFVRAEVLDFVERMAGQG